MNKMQKENENVKKKEEEGSLKGLIIEDTFDHLLEEADETR